MKDEPKDYFAKAMEYGNLRRALNRCCRDVRWKDSVVGYELHAAQNTHQIMDEMAKGTYKISPYQQFTIFEPKERHILATRIKDRQVQMSLCMNGLYDDFVEHFIHDNCACQTGKGTDFALKRLKTHLRRFYQENGKDGWVLKLDIHHFFPNTPHTVAKAAVRKRISDPRACAYVCDVIDSFGGDRGIGLGSQISQLVELSVLDDIDHFIKEKLRVKHYIRYMDDLILIHEDREFLESCRLLIEVKINHMGMELNEKTTMYPLRQGVKFLQWRFILTDTGKIVMKIDSKKMGRQRRRLKKILQKEKSGEYAEGTALNSLTAWRANAARGDAYLQEIHMRNYYYTVKAGMNNGNRAGETSSRRDGSEECEIPGRAE